MDSAKEQRTEGDGHQSPSYRPPQEYLPFQLGSFGLFGMVVYRGILITIPGPPSTMGSFSQVGQHLLFQPMATRWQIGQFFFLPRTAESFGVSAQMGSRVVRGGPEVRFHQGSTRVPPGFHQGSTRFCEGCGVVRALKRPPHPQKQKDALAKNAVGDIT